MRSKGVDESHLLHPHVASILSTAMKRFTHRVRVLVCDRCVGLGFAASNVPVANLTSPSKSLATQYLTCAGNDNDSGVSI